MSNNGIYNIDNYLYERGFIETLKHNGGSVKRKYTKLKETLATYRLKLKICNKEPTIKSNCKLYTKKFSYDSYDVNKFYKMIWDITAAKKLIKANKSPIYKLNLNQIINELAVTQDDINHDYLQTDLKINDPIIAITYEPLGRLIIIDGRRRLLSKYKANKREILGYILRPKEHIEAMIAKVYEILYKIHVNTALISKYITGYITKERLENSLYPI